MGYDLYDEEEDKYLCPNCEEPMLKIADYAECVECGAEFKKRSDG